MPKKSKPGSMPANQRLRLNHNERIAPVEYLESKANVMRVAESIRRGSTLRSWYSASCRRRKRFSAVIAFLGPDEQTEIDDEISAQLQEDAGSSHDVAIMPQISSGFGQNRGILFFCAGQVYPSWRPVAEMSPQPILDHRHWRGRSFDRESGNFSEKLFP